jgi:sRNA-binding carbon storage regulator CsrA
VLHTDVNIPTITEEITKFGVKYRQKITTHRNELASTLLEEEEPRRLKRFKPTDLITRFS